ncbi:MAG: hypothetical protein JNM88_13435 [Chitinophagaceae bacterium]|nr:hypothetical protein [Chitinophagaceae bacterium]
MDRIKSAVIIIVVYRLLSEFFKPIGRFKEEPETKQCGCQQYNDQHGYRYLSNKAVISEPK